MNSIKISETRCYPDQRGKLFVAEYGIDIPFVVKRVYYINGVSDMSTIRGCHAHKRLRQLMFCVGGSCEIVFDDGTERTIVTMDNPGKCVLVEPGIWREMINFTPNATLIVLASETYDEKDYIRNYKEFLKYTKENSI